MKRSVLFWILAVIITIGSAVYQRLTGPTHPLAGAVKLPNGHEVSFSLQRTHAGSGTAPVSVLTQDSAIAGKLMWRTYRSSEQWQTSAMLHDGGMLRAEMPARAPLQKIEYQVMLNLDGQETLLPLGSPVVMRFKGNVPLWVLIPHVIVMFAAMLIATRTGLEAFSAQPSITRFVNWTVVSLIIGGFIMGPLATYYAFNLWWTGWPVGDDITDSKTLAAFVVWVATWAIVKWVKNPKPWVFAAAVVMLIVFMIPHSISAN